MKKIIILFSAVISFTIVFASNVPEAIQKDFNQRFPVVTDLIWERVSSKGWTGEFIYNEQNTYVIYSFANAWLETKTQIPISQLPVSVSESLTSFYPDWKVMVAFKIDNAKAEQFYKVAIQSEAKMVQILLKPDGTLVSVGVD
jgi:Putative beta-lactamase-inhibitor-like, PepSY-like